jgi:hypothetical protein
MREATQADLIRRVEDYFRDVDRFDTDAILAHLTAACVLEVVNHGSVQEGLEAIRATYERRAKRVKKSWHGDFQHTVDTQATRVATRLTVRRIDADGSAVEVHNLTLFQFERSRIQRISIWMSGDNTLGG